MAMASATMITGNFRMDVFIILIFYKISFEILMPYKPIDVNFVQHFHFFIKHFENYF